MRKDKKGQVWIETVLYTLIGLALIGLALGFIMPKINQAKDKILVEQTINSLSAFDEKISEAIQRGAGNTRIVGFSMKKGELYINGASNQIKFDIGGLSKPYSEIGVPIEVGRVELTSNSEQKTYSVSLLVRYTTDIRFDGKDEERKFSAASIPYNFIIKNEGTDKTSGKIVINVMEQTS